MRRLATWSPMAPRPRPSRFGTLTIQNFKKGTNWFEVMAQDDVTVYPLEDVAKSGDRSTALQADTKADTKRFSGMEARHQVHACANGNPAPPLSSSGLRSTATGMRIQGCTKSTDQPPGGCKTKDWNSSGQTSQFANFTNNKLCFAFWYRLAASFASLYVQRCLHDPQSIRVLWARGRERASVR